MYLVLPLMAAIVFALGSIVFKRAFQEGAGIVHAMVVNNVFLGLAFGPLVFADPHPINWAYWYLPVLTAAAFVGGHLLNVLSLKVGDVSLATPLLGSKVVFVAFFGWLLFTIPLTAIEWCSAALATAGVIVMGATDVRGEGRAGLTTILALGCAAGFALTDVTIQQWAGRLGVYNFLGLQFLALAIMSAALTPIFGWRSLWISKRAWKWVFAAAVLSGLQAILITGAIGLFKDAAGVNVVYATRGLWSILLVWVVGKRFGNVETSRVGKRGMWVRVGGASLILAAVVMTVLAGQK